MNDAGVPGPAPEFDSGKLRCCGCGGWPIDEGAAFVAVTFIRQGKSERGWMCELCWLKRLQRRANYVNMSSDPMYQINVPGIGVPLHDDPMRRLHIKTAEERANEVRREHERKRFPRG